VSFAQYPTEHPSRKTAAVLARTSVHLILAPSMLALSTNIGIVGVLGYTSLARQNTILFYSFGKGTVIQVITASLALHERLHFAMSCKVEHMYCITLDVPIWMRTSPAQRNHGRQEARQLCIDTHSHSLKSIRVQSKLAYSKFLQRVALSATLCNPTLVVFGFPISNNVHL
jgi:hypothetical protein